MLLVFHYRHFLKSAGLSNSKSVNQDKQLHNYELLFSWCVETLK